MPLLTGVCALLTAGTIIAKCCSCCQLSLHDSTHVQQPVQQSPQDQVAGSRDLCCSTPQTSATTAATTGRAGSSREERDRSCCWSLIHWGFAGLRLAAHSTHQRHPSIPPFHGIRTAQA